MITNREQTLALQAKSLVQQKIYCSDTRLHLDAVQQFASCLIMD